MIGIYKITNLINGQSYIGQSVDILKRWAREKTSAFNPSDASYEYPLSRALRKYGVENFSFEILEEISQDKLNERERYWISHFNTFYNGYNQTLGGDSPIAKPKEHIIGIINDLECTDMYHREIAEKWHISTEMVQGINTGRYWFQENKTYPLQTKHKKGAQHRVPGLVVKEQNYCLQCQAPISAKATLCIKCASQKARKVTRPEATELYDYLISIKGNFSEASRHFGVSDNAIRKWCRAYGIPHTSAEYKII